MEPDSSYSKQTDAYVHAKRLVAVNRSLINILRILQY